jgi:hypothetical protein
MSIISETEMAGVAQDVDSDSFQFRNVLTLVLLALVVIGLAVYYFTAARPVKAVDTEYQAFMLDNGSEYYGRVVQSTTGEVVLSEVYYVQSRTDPKTKQASNVLVKRGKEWHGPDRMVINRQHLLFVEPVAPNSTVAKLIAELKKQ